MIWKQRQEMVLSHFKTLMPQRLTMCTVLEPFRKLDSVSSPPIPPKDRFMVIYWNRQKASLWQEAVGNTQTGTPAHRNWKTSWLASGNMSLPIIRFRCRFLRFIM